MPKDSANSERRALAALMAQKQKLPHVAATKLLIRAGFLFTNGTVRPYHKLGMNVSQVDVLAALAQSESASLSCSEIAQATLITKGGITGILDRLEVRGLVQRLPSRDDRRSIRIQLTEKGLEFCRALFPQLAESNEEIFARALKPEQLKQLTKLLTLLVQSMETDSESASEPAYRHEPIS